MWPVRSAAKHARRTGPSPKFRVWPPKRRWSIRPSGVRLNGRPMCSSSITVSIGLAGEDLGRVLVDQVVAALDRVEHVPLPVVLLLVAQGGTDAALGGAGMGAGRVELGQDGGVDAGLGELERGPQAGAAGADDERVVLEAASGQPFGHDRQGHDDDRAEDEQERARAGRGPSGGQPRAAPGVVDDDRPDAHERVEQDEHQQRPVEGPPEEAAPADLGDPRRVLLGRVVDDVDDQEVGQGQDEQPGAGDAASGTRSRARGRRPAAGRGRTGCSGRSSPAPLPRWASG